MENLVTTVIDAVIAEFHADRNRIYLSGFSMGGAGVYGIAARWPERFAALVVISGPVSRLDMLVERIHRIPIRIFQGEADERVPVAPARDFVGALQKAGADVQYTETEALLVAKLASWRALTTG
jgi:predicted peptidase